MRAGAWGYFECGNGIAEAVNAMRSLTLCHCTAARGTQTLSSALAVEPPLDVLDVH